MRIETDLITGSGGGGGGGKGKGGSSKDARNTLRSNARARMIELISEGVIEGLVDGEKSIYFEQTPVMNEDGTFNFKNVNWEEHKGFPDENHFTGVTATESPEQVEVQVKKSTGPVTRTIVEPNADAVRVILRIPALFKSNKKDGSLRPASLSYKIEVRAYQGAWQEAVTNNIEHEKCVSPYQIAHRVDLPFEGSPWDIRVTRITDDSDDAKVQNDLYWEGYVVLTEGKFTYPNSAAISLEVNAEDMGQSIPARSFHVRGIKVLVPSNYDPLTRTYTGIWDGNFKRAWTNNPAWIFYDLLTNDRYGLGEFVAPEIVDKWSLYTIAQYCDQLVPSGYKNGDTGADIMEPRFSYNGVINSRDEAYFVLQQVATAWRGMAYWCLGQVFATADMPDDPVKLVAPANVIDGEFNYAGTAQKARHSVCIVQWNDPDDFYRPGVELVINEEMLRRFGWREKKLQLNGCTSRGLAHRYGKWVLDVEQHETETVEYSASWDHADVRPGQIIAISDPAKAQARLGGRIKHYDSATKTVTIDGPFEPGEGATYELMAVMPDGTIEKKGVTSFPAADQILLTEAFSQEPVVNAMFAITGSDIRPRLYRVISHQETAKNVFKITALFHDPDKYARVEQNVLFDPVPYTRPKNVAYPPTNLAVREVSYTHNGVTKSRLVFSWTPNPNFMAKSFRIDVITPFDGLLRLGDTDRNWIELDNVVAGTYTFSVSSINYVGMSSEPATFEYEATGPEGIPLPTVSNLRLADRPASNNFVGRDVHVVWDNNFAESSDPTADDGALAAGVSSLYRKNIVEVYDNATNTLLRTQSVTSANFTYTYAMNVADSAAAALSDPCRSLRFEVVVVDTFGRQSQDAAVEIFSNQVPAAVVPAYTIADNFIYLEFPPSNDEDFAGYLIWRETGSGFDPLVTEPFTDTNSNTVTIQTEPSTDYYFRFAAYDAFGKTGLNIAEELHLQTASGFDGEPPAVPTNLALSSIVIVEDAGFVTLKAVWDANTENDFAYYDIQVKEDTGDWVSYTTTETSISWRVLPGVAFSARIRAVDKIGNFSAFSAIEQHTTILDDVAPAAPTDLKVFPGLDAMWLTWVNSIDADFSHVEIYQNDTNDSSTATKIADVRGTSFSITGRDFNETLYYWLKAVDTSGNTSAFTDSATATTGTIPDSELSTVSGIVFSPNDPQANRLSWTAGSISYGMPGGAPTTKAISAGFVDWSVGTIYVYYVKGNAALSTTTNLATVYASSGILLGIYKGGVDFQIYEGKAKFDGGLIIGHTIGADALVTDQAVITGSAQIALLVVKNEHVESIDAIKLYAEDIEGNNALIGLVNDANVKIDPGQILISGSTSLADWRYGGDQTLIDGGNIAANTIAANSAVFGMRGVQLEGIEFEANSDGVLNRLRWSSGTITYVGDDGNIASYAITGNFAQHPGPGTTWYIFYEKGTSVIAATQNAAAANASFRIILGIYRGGTDLVVNYGRTIIDGSHILTGTITALQADIDSFRSNILTANVIKSTMIDSDTITGRHMVLSDLGNLVPSNQLLAAQDWSLNGNSPDTLWSLVPVSGAWKSKQAWKYDPANKTTNFTGVLGLHFPAKPGVQYLASFQAQRLTGTKSQIWGRVMWMDDTGATISWSHVINNSTTFTFDNSATITAPANAKMGRWEFYIWQDNTDGVTLLGAPEVREMNAASLTVDGGIKARHIDVDSLDAISATIGTFQSAASGQRVKISDSLIQVYDSNNVERVRLGVW